MADRVVVLLGMHRSGTSMLARLLGALGLRFGERLLREARPDNELGYWEQADIVGIQEAMLDRMDRTWYGPTGTLSLPDGWRDRPGMAGMVDRLREVLVREVAASGGLWGFKDPRTARFLPMWKELFAEAGIEPVYVLAIRHPDGVRGSLLARNAAQGMTPERADLLWLVHNAEILDAVGDRLAAVVDYDSWFDDPVATATHLTAAIGLPPPSPGALDGFVRTDLRHHAGHSDTSAPLALALYRAVAAGAPQPPPHGAYRPLLEQFDAARRLFGDWERALEGAILDRWRLAGARRARTTA